MRALADQSTRSAAAAERNAAAAEQTLAQVLQDDHKLEAAATFGLDDWATKQTRFAVRVVLLNRGNRQETVYSAQLVIKDDLNKRSGLYLSDDQKGPFVLAPGQVIPFNLQPMLGETVLGEMKWTSEMRAEAKVGVEFVVLRPDGTEGRFAYPFGTLKYNDGPENYSLDNGELARRGKWMDVLK